MFDHVFLIDYQDCPPNEKLHSFLQKETSQDIIEFGIPDLPAQYQLKIEILTYKRFQQGIHETNLSASVRQHCIAYSDNAVHCIDYSFLADSMPIENYLMIIRHECIHILQHLATRIPPQLASWLYESVACARAGQKMPRPAKVPPWHGFVTDFSSIPERYALAYEFGTCLLKHVSLGELVKRCKDFVSFKDECEKIYNDTFSQ